MRYLSFFVVVSLALTISITHAFAESPESQALKSKVDMLENELKEIKDLLKHQVEKDAQKEKEIASLRKEVKTVAEKTPAQPVQPLQPSQPLTDQGTAMQKPNPNVPYLAQQGTQLEENKLSSQFGGIYTKPFLRRFGRNTYVGGYMDFEFRATEDKDGNNGFNQQRFIPFIYSDISDRVKLASEIEFENGGVSDENHGEVKLEFATIDFLVKDWINWRGGFVLLPLGKYNLVHDSPLQDLTDRPMVDRVIIPTSLTDLGMGFYGSFYPSDLSKLDYEIYATNGAFHGLDADGTSHFSLKKGLRSTIMGGDYDFTTYDNYNRSPAVIGRLNFSPFIGLEFGGSFFTGRYDEKNNNQLTIPAFDFAYQRGAFELVGEGAYAFIARDNFAKAHDVPDGMWGYYIESRYHFMPSVLKSWSPSIFTEHSTFTGVLRWEQVQTAGYDGGKSVQWMQNRVTPGLNYRYTEDTVFKLDYQINMEEKDMPELANNAFIFSVATYF